ncbi:MAG TPA: transketolase C-terminal domain-containing protein, partial [Bacteroidales bacterium]|nr:transketolase C-terminal domain-containing protein [Bacteroidales bacterium]
LNDIAAMRVLPDMTVILPCDVHQTGILTEVLTHFDGPVYVRMGRGAVPEVYTKDNAVFEIGKANLLLEGKDVALIGTGETVYHCLQAAGELKKSGISACVIDMHTVKPLDTDILRNAALKTGRIVTVEEHHVFGGLGSAVAEWVVQNCNIPVKILGFPDENAVHGSSGELFAYYGLDSKGICKSVREIFNRRKDYTSKHLQKGNN